MADISQLITEYSAITGRPAATLSVTEFLEFKKYSEKHTAHVNMAFSNGAPLKEVQRGAAPSTEPVSYTKEEVEDTPRTNKVSEPDCRTESEEMIEEMEEKTKTVSNAFLMMRSISG